MLSKIRERKSNLFFKLILLFVAIIFIVGGGAFIMRPDQTEQNLVEFDHTDPITLTDFLIAKKRYINILQNQSNVALTEENLKELGVNTIVLRRLISDSLMNYLSKKYEFCISDEKFIDKIKSAPIFQDSNGNFDKKIFLRLLRDMNFTEEEYSKNIKDSVKNNVLIEIFARNYVVPNDLVNAISRYISESRTVDILSIDLLDKPKDYKEKEYSDKQLMSFYKNSNIFVNPELRSFNYIKIEESALEKKIKVSEQKLKQYFNDNKDNFNSNDYKKIRSQVREEYLKEQKEKLLSELAKNLEEEVSAGMNLKEISEKYDVPIKSAKDISQKNMNNSDNSSYIEMSDTVFELTEGELSYPFEIQDKNEILLVEVTKIKPSSKISFKYAKEQILKMLHENDLKKYNVDKIAKYAKDYPNILKENSKQTNKKNKKNKKNKNTSKSIKIATNQHFIRNDLNEKTNVPIRLIQNMFDVELKTITNVFVENNKAYIAYIKTQKVDNKKVNQVKKNNEDKLINTFKEDLLNSILTYLRKENNTKFNEKLLKEL